MFENSYSWPVQLDIQVRVVACTGLAPDAQVRQSVLEAPSQVAQRASHALQVLPSK